MTVVGGYVFRFKLLEEESIKFKDHDLKDNVAQLCVLEVPPYPRLKSGLLPLLLILKLFSLLSHTWCSYCFTPFYFAQRYC